MRVVRTTAEMVPLGGGDLGFVPTMGAFHEGHLSLMRASRERHKTLAVSLFVNPLQFAPNEDLSRYPRDEVRDLTLAEAVGVDLIFAPAPEEFTSMQGTYVHVSKLADRWEGAWRPGHFDGVATIVAKLFNVVRPSAAYFGWKDLQQCLVIRRVVQDLNFPVQLLFNETVREPDGLAMSSRNAYLSAEERRVAPGLFRAISAVAETASRDRSLIDDAISRWRSVLESDGFAVDYLELVSLSDLAAARAAGECAVIAAARLGSTRLIDNVRLTLS